MIVVDANVLIYLWLKESYAETAAALLSSDPHWIAPLLWRSEFGNRHPFGASLPAEGVWQKVLTAPDNSFLSIRHHGKKVGTCHWSPSVGQDRAARHGAAKRICDRSERRQSKRRL